MSVFDPDAFMQSTITEAGSTSLDPVPAGEYPAVIEDIKVREAGKEGDKKPVLDVVWSLQDGDLKARLGREKITIRQTIWLDTTSNGTLDMSKGKNVGLNRVREALGQNNAGQPWSMANLKGAGPALVAVSLRPDKNDSSVIYNDIKSVGKFS